MVLFLLVTAAFASQSTNYISNPNSAGSSGSTGSSANYASSVSLGGASSGVTPSGSFIGLAGFMAATMLATDVFPPTITNVKFGGKDTVNNDFTTQNATLTATVLDLGSGVSLESSRILVDGAATAFSALTSPSTYDAVTGALTCALSLGTGTHYVTIEAFDNNYNHATYTRLLQVDTGGVRAAATFIYPNPYNPDSGTAARIAYQLNSNADVTLYMFNEINGLVWKRTFAAGTNGGQQGYNEVAWNGSTDFNDVAQNGAYFLRIVSGGKVIGKIKIAILK